MKGALDVHRELLSRDVPHEIVRLPAPVVSADDLPRALGLEAARCVAVRCYVVDGEFVAVLVSAGATPAPAALLDALGAGSLRPATASEVNAATDYAARLVSPVALPPAVPLLADSALGGPDVLYAPVGEGGLALGIHTRDLLVASGARAAALTVEPLLPADRAPWDEVGRVIELDRPARRPRAG